jgi:signal transduction histidine kinase
VLTEVLRGAGHEVVAAANGDEGLEAIRRAPPDAVVCDIQMPGLNGFGVLNALRADPRLAAIPFVFLTSEPKVREGMASGADDYLVKPVDEDVLLAALAARLARRDTARREGERRVNELRRAVASLLPHELRTPLTTIIGSARLLQEFHRDFEPAQIEETARGILKAAQRLNRMAENYILFADLELNRLSGRADTGWSLSGRSGPLEVQAAARDTSSQSGRAPDLALEVEDVGIPLGPSHVAKIVSELVDNALKFSPPGALVRVSLRASGGVCLEVTDHGRGMSADQVADVGAFRQFDRDRFEQQGSGVGLALVRAIAEASGGRVDIVSTPGEGTTVRVTWPSTH